MEGMADGGIAGYADEDEAVGYADGGVVHMQAGGLTEAEIRAQGRSLGTPQPLIEIAVQNARMAAENAQQQQRQLPFTSATPSGVSVPQIRTSAYEASANPPMIPNPRMTGETPAVGPDDPSKAFTRRNIAEAAARVPELRRIITSMENAPYVAPPAPPAPPVAENKKPPSEYKPTGIRTLKAPAVPDIDTPTLEKTSYDVGDQPTVAAIKGQVGQLVDSSDLMTKIEGAQADLRRQGKEAMDFYEKNKPRKNLFSETVARLDKEDALGVNKKEQAQAMALMMAGFKMMESPYGGKGLGAVLRNIGAGAKVGAENYSSAVEKFEAAAERRNQQRTTIEAARDAAERGDFATRMNLMQHGQQLSAQANALGVSAAQDLFKVNADIGTKLLAAAETQYNTNKNVAAQLGSEERRAQFSTEAADRRAMFGAKMEMLKTQFEQAGANARAMAPTAEMRMAMALGGGNLEAGLRRAAEISAGKTDLAKLYVQSKAEYDAKNPMGGQAFMSPQEFVSLYNQVSVFRAPPNPMGSPTGKVFQ
jgi:hypothetical protein